MFSSMLKSAAMRVPRIRRVVEQRDDLVEYLRKEHAQIMAMLDEQGKALEELARNVGTLPGPRDEATRAKIEELTTTNAQLEDALECAGVPPIPPAHLQWRVVGVRLSSIPELCEHGPATVR